MSDYILHAEWEKDCNGKQNYDGPVIAISSRLWPPNYADKKFTARCSLSILGHNFPDVFPDHVHCLIERGFEGKTEKEVKLKVEEFAQAQMDRVVKAVQEEFYVDPNGSRN